AQISGTLVAFLGIFGWGLFACTLVPALAIGIHWRRATPAAAVASISTGLVLTLTAEALAYARILRLPEGITVSALALCAAVLVFVVVAFSTGDAENERSTAGLLR